MTAALLRQAATVLEELAARATPGSWLIEYSYDGTRPQALFVECLDGEDCEHLDCYDGTLSVGGFEHPDDNVWASLLGPELAAPLATWLRATAELIENPLIVLAEGHAPSQVPEIAEPYALTLARTILGETS